MSALDRTPLDTLLPECPVFDCGQYMRYHPSNDDGYEVAQFVCDIGENACGHVESAQVVSR